MFKLKNFVSILMKSFVITLSRTPRKLPPLASSKARDLFELDKFLEQAAQ
jgi:hypothetical protein